VSTSVCKRNPTMESQEKTRHRQHTTGKQPGCSHLNVHTQRVDRYSEGYKLSRTQARRIAGYGIIQMRANQTTKDVKSTQARFTRSRQERGVLLIHW